MSEEIKIDLPSWCECSIQHDALERNDRSIFERTTELSPLEKFIYDNEPVKNSGQWRKDLRDAIEYAWQFEVIKGS